MAGRENIGGFYYSLGVDTDKGSFARASDAIGGLVNVVKTAAAAIGVGFAVKATVDKAVEDLNLSEKIGVSIYQLDKMRLAASLVGVNFHGIANEMDSLNKKFRDIELGDWDQASATALAQLKDKSGMAVGYEDLRYLSAEERLRRLLAAAQSMSDKGLAGDLLGKIMGAGTRDLFLAMSARNKTWGGLLEEAERHTFDNTEAKKSLDELHQEMMKIKGTAEGIWTNVLGTMSSKWLEPGMHAISTWLGDNKEAIEKGIGVAFEVVEKTWTVALGAVEKIATHIATIFGVMAELITDIYNLTNKVIDKGKELGDAGIQKAVEINDEMRNSDNPFIKTWVGLSDMLGNFLTNGGQLHDGIISPGGGITKVDSNDWVLAFKNLGDVAGAFHQGGQGGVANVTISQTFNVNGNPMPGAVRDQAYRGTTSAMSEAFTRAGMIIQMMPGTR